MVTHCCFGCESLQLQSVKSSLVAWDGMSVFAFHHCGFFFCRSRGGMGLQDCGGGPYGTVETRHCSTGELLKQRDNSGRELITPHSQNRALACHILLKKALPSLIFFLPLCVLVSTLLTVILHHVAWLNLNGNQQELWVVVWIWSLRLRPKRSLQCDINEWIVKNQYLQ